MSKQLELFPIDDLDNPHVVDIPAYLRRQIKAIRTGIDALSERADQLEKEADDIEAYLKEKK